MNILRSGISEDRNIGQLDLLYILFEDCFRSDDMSAFVLDNGLVCRWMNGQAKVSPKITGFYISEKANRILLRENFQRNMLTLFFDIGFITEKLHELLVQDSSISEKKRMELDKDYPCETDEAISFYIVNILLFGMERNFVKREPPKKNLLTSGNMSPAIADYIYENDVPKPCRFFCGRETELDLLHEKLTAEGKVFLHGIAGIGKSELAKMYALQHRREYTNILYFTYSGNLSKDIADMDFSDDLPDDPEQECFRKHNRFLRSLKEDTLIIIDNFNTTPSRESFLSVMLKYKCRLLFATRSRIDGQPCVLLEEINDRYTLMELFGKFFADAATCPSTVEQIIESVHSHTFAVELSARLLQTGKLEPEELLEKLRAEKTGMSATDQIPSSKDGENRKATYYEHIHTLFMLCSLSDEQRFLMRCMAMTPSSGIPARLFAVWTCQPDMNHLNDLTEMGFIQPLEGRMITLHDMMREITITDEKPSVANCSTMLTYHREEIFRYAGKDTNGYKFLFETVVNIADSIIVDDPESYLLYLEDAFNYMEKYSYSKGMRKVLSAIDAFLNDPHAGSTKDRILLLDCQAVVAYRIEEDLSKAIKLEEKAAALLPETDKDNALLVSNIHANLGALYRLSGKNVPAMEHMEKGISVLEQFGLIYTNDSVAQICNYAVLLYDTGEPDRALYALEKCAATVRKYNSDDCLDYAAVEEATGNIHLNIGNLDQAREHLKTAMQIYETVWADEPELIEEKYARIEDSYTAKGIDMGRSRFK